MRRNWRRLSAAILVLAAIGLGTAALFWAVTRGPFMSAVASRLLGRPVEIATISLIPARALEIEVTGLVIRDPTTGEVQIEVPHARARQPWPWLLAGEFFPLHWEFDSPVIRLSPEQRTKPAVLNVPPVDLVVRDGTIELRVAKEVYRVHDLALDLRRSQLRPRATGRASGELRRGERALGRFDARVEGWLRDATAVVKLDAVQLESLPLDFDGDVGGVARGELRVRYEQSGIGVEVDVSVESFALRLAGMSALVAPKTTRLRGKVSWSAEGLRMEPKGLQFDDLVLTGLVTVGSGPGARVRADLTLADFEPGRPAGQRVNGVKLMAMRFESWERANQRIEAGRVEDLRVRLDLPLAGLGSALSFRRRLRPGEFEFDARVSGGVYRTSPDTPPLEDISARLEVTGNRLVVHELKMSREGSALPVIDLDVDGMHRLVRLPPEERRAPRGPGEPIPGLAAAARALVRPGRDAREPLVVELSDLYLGHPALVLPFRDAEAELRFPDGKLRVQARGIYGGAPAELEILYDPQAHHVRADVRYLDGDAPPRSDTGDLWLSAKLGVPALQLGRWRLEDIQVNVAAQGALVSFDGGRAVFGGGDTELRGTVALGAGSHALVDFHTRTTNADLDAVNEPLRLRPGALAGRADFNGLWRGRLEPGQDFLDHADLAIDLHATKGAIAHLPASVALARVPSLQGIRGLFGRPLPYDEINARFLVRDGILRAESLSLSGPELRLLAAGELDLVAPERPADLLLAFMFLQTVDKMIELVPIIGSWVLGEDDNLVTIYVRVKGPWASPSASLVPPQSVRTAAGWAERMIGAGVAQLRKILSIPPKKKEAPDVPKDTSELARPG